jgi:dipeptidase
MNANAKSRNLLHIAVLLTVVLAGSALRSVPGTEGTWYQAYQVPDSDFSCFTVLVGRKASADGSVMVAHNEDDRGDIIVNVRKIAPRDYGSRQRVALGPPGGVRPGSQAPGGLSSANTSATSVSASASAAATPPSTPTPVAYYETDGRTNGFLWIEATTQEFADSFINDHGVLITSDSCPSRVSTEDYTDGGIGWMLRRLVAEKAVSARDAVRLAGALIEKYGYRASGRTYSIADRREAWMLAALRGRRWFAQRVPDDEVAVIPNHYTIRAIRPSDPDHFMGSRDIIAYAAANGWYDPSRDGPFDFKRAFERPSNRDLVSDGNSLRHWRGLNLLGDRPRELSRDYPFSFKPARKITPEALMAVLRDHYEGTEYDATNGYKTGSPNRTKFRTICTASTINSFVVSLRRPRPSLPEPLAVSIWLALGKPDTTVFLPLYYGVENLPPGAGLGPQTHDYRLFYEQHFNDVEFKAARSAFLNTRVLELEKAVEADYGPRRARLEQELFPLEQELVGSRPKFEAEFAALFRRDRRAALKKLDEYVADAFARAADLTAKALADMQ